MANAQMLLDPFEKQFDLPALLIERGDGQRGQHEIVLLGKPVSCLFPDRKNARDAKFRIVAARVESIERDALIGAEAGRFIDWPRIDAIDTSC